MQTCGCWPEDLPADLTLKTIGPVSGDGVAWHKTYCPAPRHNCIRHLSNRLCGSNENCSDTLSNQTRAERSESPRASLDASIKISFTGSLRHALYLVLFNDRVHISFATDHDGAFFVNLLRGNVQQALYSAIEHTTSPC